MSQLALQLIQQEKAAKTGYLDLGYCGLSCKKTTGRFSFFRKPTPLEEVWGALSELTHLETLVLSNWWNDSELRVLRRSQNKGGENLLDKIPIAIADLTNLKILVIEGSSHQKWQITEIENLPESLSTFNINNNQIVKIENLPKNISTLNISGNQITKLENLPENLESLDIRNNQISDLSPFISLTEKELQCDITGNPIKHTPQFAKYLIAKEKVEETGYLDIGCCGLSSESVEVQDLKKLTHLETLILSNRWYDHEQQEWLDSQNKGRRNVFNKIPTAITDLINLKKLITAGDYDGQQWEIAKIKNLPQSLTTINICNNQIKDLQPLLPFIKKEIYYNVYSNPIESPPIEIVKQGKEAIIRYFEENENKDDNT